jgi:hypothetical protein
MWVLKSPSLPILLYVKDTYYVSYPYMELSVWLNDSIRPHYSPKFRSYCNVKFHRHSHNRPWYPTLSTNLTRSMVVWWVRLFSVVGYWGLALFAFQDLGS